MINATNLLVQHRIDSDVEIVVDFLNLDQVFILHFSTGLAFWAILRRVGEQNLVNNNISNINLLLGQLNTKSLSFVHAQEFRDADSHESCLISICKLLVNFFDFLFHTVEGLEDLLLQFFRVYFLATLTAHCLHLSEHASEFFLELDQLQNTFFEDFREFKKSKGMSSWCSIKYNKIKLVIVKSLHNLSKWGGLINSGNASHYLVEKALALLLGLFVHALHDILTLEHGLEAHSILLLRINLKSIQVRKSIDLHGFFPIELLVKGVTQVMSWVRWDDQDWFSVLGHLYGYAAGCSGLAHTPFASNKEPLECLLINEILECCGHFRFLVFHFQQLVYLLNYKKAEFGALI